MKVQILTNENDTYEDGSQKSQVVYHQYNASDTQPDDPPSEKYEKDNTSLEKCEKCSDPHMNDHASGEIFAYTCNACNDDTSDPYMNNDNG